jgi:hypothetical protein
MNSRRKFFVLGLIVVFLVVPFLPQQQAIASYTIKEVTDTSSKFGEASTFPKLLPAPPTDANYTYDYFNGIGPNYAETIFFSVGDQFPFTAIPTNRIYDLTAVQFALTCIDLYYVTEDVFYLNQAWTAALPFNMFLEANGTFIKGEDYGSVYEIYAEENLLLVIMYERLAEALIVDGDFFNAGLMYNLADNLLSNITALFYDVSSQSINETLTVNSAGDTVIGLTPHSSARVTGLYYMANNLANDSSRFYTQAKNALNYYRNIANTTVLLPTLDFGYLYYSTFNSGAASDSDADLQGNIYMNTALIQESLYQSSLNNPSIAWDFFNWTKLGEEAMKEYFKSPDTGLFHTKYDLGTLQLEDVALTYENCLYLSHLVEFKRSRLNITGITPAFMEINDLYDTMKSSVFLEPDLFLAGTTKTGAVLDLIYDIPHSNPHIVNYQAVTMMLKFYPLVTMLAYPNQISLNQPTLFDWVFDLAETTSVFGSSTKAFSLNFLLEVTSQTLWSIQYPNNYRINTTVLNGIRIQASQTSKLNVTADQGGWHDIQFNVYLAGYHIFDTTYSIFIDKTIEISTEPTNLEVTELLDKDLVLTVYLTDETGLGINNAEVTVFPDYALPKAEFTDNWGYVTFYIPIQELMPVTLPEGTETSFNSTILIVAYKNEHLPSFIYKDVTVKLNNLILDLNPSPPEVKEASDLSLYLDVTSRIPASIFNPVARITINEIPYEDRNHKTSWNLPATVIIGKNWLKNGTKEPIIVDVEVTASGLTEPAHFTFEVYVEPMGTLERIYFWIETALQSDIVKIIGSLGLIWAILWRQFSLRIWKRLRRCPYCGDISKRKYPYCKNCGLKDESLEYKKKVKKEHKEPRITRAEAEASKKPVKPIIPKPPVQQPAEQPPTDYHPPVEKKFNDSLDRTFEEKRDDSFDNSFDKKSDDDYNY